MVRRKGIDQVDEMDPSLPAREAPLPVGEAPLPAREAPPAAREAPSKKARSQPDAVRPVILFDGVCNLCNAMVRWVVEHDADGWFRFAPLQSEAARRLLDAGAEASAETEAAKGASRTASAGPAGTMALVDQAGVHFRSTAALRVAKRLEFPWSLLGWLSVVPRPLRDAVYDCVARNRYRWFGRRATCPIPGPDLAKRLLDPD